MTRSRAVALVAGLLLAAPAAAQDAVPGAVEDALPALPPPSPFAESARSVAGRAFENFYGCDLSQQVDFVVRAAGKAIFHYEITMARKHAAGTAYELYDFVGVNDYRRMRVLRIERRERSDDVFVYLPQFDRVRRITTAQGADKVLGLNISFEDVEIKWIDRFEVVGRSFGEIVGEPVHVVTLQPLFASGYDRADYFIAQSDYAFLEIRYYRGGADEPFKLARMRRDEMESQGGHVLPRRVEYVNRQDGTETEVRFRERRVDPPLPDVLFTKSNLESQVRRLHFGSGAGSGPGGDG